MSIAITPSDAEAFVREANRALSRWAETRARQSPEEPIPGGVLAGPNGCQPQSAVLPSEVTKQASA